MKYYIDYFDTYEDASPPARVVWIEMYMRNEGDTDAESPPARVVWIEIGNGFSLFSQPSTVT